MTPSSPGDTVRWMLGFLREKLTPFVEMQLADVYGEDQWKQTLTTTLAQQRTWRTAPDIHWDIQALFDVMTWLWKDVFSRPGSPLGHYERALVGELWEARKWNAHQHLVTPEQAFHALTSAKHLLQAIGETDLTELMRCESQLLQIIASKATDGGVGSTIVTAARDTKAGTTVAYSIVGATQEELRGALTELDQIASCVPGMTRPIAAAIDGMYITIAAAPASVMLRDRQSIYLERHRLIAGRSAHIEAIEIFIQERHRGFICITGPSGYGKSALLANVLARRPAEYAWYFLNRVDGTHRPLSFLQQMCEQMLVYYQLPLSANVRLPDDVDLLTALYAHLLRLPLVRVDKPMVLVIDGLDEAEDDFVDDRFISPDIANGKFIVFSARQNARGGYHLRFGLNSEDVLSIHLQSLDMGAITDLLRLAGEPARQWANDPEVVAQILAVSEGDPLYLHYLVQDIVDGAISPEQVRQRPRGLFPYLSQWWNLIVQDVRADHFRQDILGLLMATLGPLPRSDLLRILADPSVEWALDDILAPLKRFVVTNYVDGEEAYSLDHPRFAAFLHEDKLRGQAEGFRERIISYCQHWQKHRSRYAFRHLAQHLIDTRRFGDLIDLIGGDHDGELWAEARRAAEGSYAGYLQDLELAYLYLAVPEQPSTTVLAWLVHLALIKASLRNVANNLPGKLISALLERAIWTPQIAVDYLRLMPVASQRLFSAHGYEQRLEALSAVAPFLHASQIDEVLSIIEGFPDAAWEAQALVALKPYVPANAAPRILLLVRDLTDPVWRAYAALELANLSPDRLAVLSVDDAVAVVHAAIGAAGKLTPAVEHLLPVVARYGRPMEAMNMAGKIGDDVARTRMNLALIHLMPDEVRQDIFLHILSNIEANNLIDSLHYNVISAAVQLARLGDLDCAILAATMVVELVAKWDGILNLHELLTLLPSQSRENLARQALTASQELFEPGWRAGSLIELVPHLDGAERQEAVQRIRVEARALTEAQPFAGSSWLSATILLQLSQYLDSSPREDVIAEAIQVVSNASDSDDAHGWCYSYMPEELPSLLAAAGCEKLAIRVARLHRSWNASDKASSLARLASQLTDMPAERVLREALLSARNVGDDSFARRAMQYILSYTMIEVLAIHGREMDSLDMLMEDCDDNECIDGLSILVPHLTDAGIEEVLRRPLLSESANVELRARAIAVLAAHMSAQLATATLEDVSTGDDSSGLHATKELLVRLAVLGQVDAALDIAMDPAQTDYERMTLLQALLPYATDAQLPGAADRKTRLLPLLYPDDHNLAMRFETFSKGPSEVISQLEQVRVTDTTLWLQLLADLVPHRSEVRTEGILEDALDALELTDDQSIKCGTLESISPYLPARLLPRALDLILALEDSPWLGSELLDGKPRALNALALRLTELPQNEMYSLWRHTLWHLADNDRRSLLRGILALMPVSYHLDEYRILVSMIGSISAVLEWYP